MTKSSFLVLYLVVSCKTCINSITLTIAITTLSFPFISTSPFNFISLAFFLLNYPFLVILNPNNTTNTKHSRTIATDKKRKENKGFIWLNSNFHSTWTTYIFSWRWKGWKVCVEFVVTTQLLERGITSITAAVCSVYVASVIKSNITQHRIKSHQFKEIACWNWWRLRCVHIAPE